MFSNLPSQRHPVAFEINSYYPLPKDICFLFMVMNNLSLQKGEKEKNRIYSIPMKAHYYLCFR